MTVRSIFGPILVSALLVFPSMTTAGMIVQSEAKTQANFLVDTVFNRFNSALGTLTQVTLDIDLSLTVFASSSIFGPGFCVATTLCAGDITLAVNGISSLTPLSLSDAEPVSDADVDTGIFVDLELTDSINFSNLADFSLPGGLVRLETTVIPDGFVFPVFSNESGNITLTYQFDDPVTISPIPEPAIIALFGIGLAGLGFARRKQSAY